MTGVYRQFQDYKEVKPIMFWSKNSIIEKISKISNTLDDISADIFCGINTDSEYLHKLSLSEEGSSNTPL